MKYFFLSFFIFSSQAFACWNMNAVFSVGEAEFKVNQKINHDQTYSFSAPPYIYNVKVASQALQPPGIPKKKGSHFIEIGVVQKDGTTLKQVAHGQMLVTTGKEATMTKQDESSAEITTFKLTLNEI